MATVVHESCGCGASIAAQGFGAGVELRRFRAAHEPCRVGLIAFARLEQALENSGPEAARRILREFVEEPVSADLPKHPGEQPIPGERLTNTYRRRRR